MDVFFFSRWKFWSPETQILPRKTRKTYLAKTKQYTSKYSVTAWQGFVEHVCHFSGSVSHKRRGHWMLNKFRAICLNQPVGRSISRSERGQFTLFLGLKQLQLSHKINRTDTNPMAVMNSLSWYFREGTLFLAASRVEIRLEFCCGQGICHVRTQLQARRRRRDGARYLYFVWSVLIYS